MVLEKSENFKGHFWGENKCLTPDDTRIISLVKISSSDPHGGLKVAQQIDGKEIDEQTKPTI